MTYNAETLYSEGETGYAELMRDMFYQAIKKQFHRTPVNAYNVSAIADSMRESINVMRYHYGVQCDVTVLDGNGKPMFTVSADTLH
jgi:hypothetical protein